MSRIVAHAAFGYLALTTLLNPAHAQATRSCRQTSECRGVAVCVRGRCQARQCSQGRPCSRDQLCVQGRCVTKRCDVDDDCSVDRACVDGLCALPPPPPLGPKRRGPEGEVRAGLGLSAPAGWLAFLDLPYMNGDAQRQFTLGVGGAPWTSRLGWRLGFAEERALSRWLSWGLWTALTGVIRWRRAPSSEPEWLTTVSGVTPPTASSHVWWGLGAGASLRHGVDLSRFLRLELGGVVSLMDARFAPTVTLRYGVAL